MAEKSFRLPVLKLNIFSFRIIFAPDSLVLIFLLFLIGWGIPAPSLGFLFRMFFAAFFAVSSIICLLVHECSHMLTARHFGYKARDIWIIAFGGLGLLEENPKSPRDHFLIAAAGPGASFFLYLVFNGIFSWLAGQIYDQNTLTPLFKESLIFTELLKFLWYLYYFNLVLALFNLLPAFPTDGGRIMQSILWFGGKDERKATYAALRVGNFVCYFLIILGLYQWVFMVNFSGFWLALIAFMLLQNQKVIKRSLDNPGQPKPE